MSPTDPADVRCLCLDVDGVLTDGRIYIDDTGHRAREFHVHDGLAIRWYQKLGGVVAIITGKESGAVANRAQELGIEHVFQGSQDKLADFQCLMKRLELVPAQAAVIGDDLPDLAPLRACGYPIAVANAAKEVKAIARYVTERPGGQGAVRDAVEHLVREAGRWKEVVERYERSEESGKND